MRRDQSVRERGRERARVPSANPAPPLGTLVKRWLLAYWGVIASLRICKELYFYGAPEESGEFVRLILGSLAAVGIWVGVCMVAFVLTRTRNTFGIDEVLKLGGLAVLLALANQALQDAVECDIIRAGCSGVVGRLTYAWLGLPNTIAITINVFGVAWMVRSVALSREHRARTHTAQVELFRAQARVLDRQLRPHFLFNTLQSVATLIHADPGSARHMLLGLRALLEHSLTSASQPEISLEEEIRVIRLYLEIETLRFGDSLEVRFELSPEVANAGIPPFLLQPLVENAVHHAIAVQGGGRIVIRATRLPRVSRLHLTISDTGAGSVPNPRNSQPGIGMQNARTRLQLLYGSDWELELRPNEGGGSDLTLSLPFHRHFRDVVR
jgi:hypothetical protein